MYGVSWIFRIVVLNFVFNNNIMYHNYVGTLIKIPSSNSNQHGQ